MPSRSACPALHGQLPCGCSAPVPASRAASSTTASAAAAAAADSLLVALAAEWPRTPPATQFCLRALGDAAARRGARPIGGCAGLHILGACMAQHLRRQRQGAAAQLDLGLGAEPEAVLQKLVEALTDEVRRPASVLRIMEAVGAQSAGSMLAPYVDSVDAGPTSPSPSASSGGGVGGSASSASAWQDRRQLAAMLSELDAAGHLPHLVGLGHLLRRNADCLTVGLGVTADEAAAASTAAVAAAAAGAFVCDLGPMEAAPFDPLRAAQRMGSDQRARYFDVDEEAAELQGEADFDDEDDDDDDDEDVVEAAPSASSSRSPSSSSSSEESIADCC